MIVNGGVFENSGEHGLSFETKEGRTALICAAVTGKIDVRGFQGLENNLVGETV